MEKMKVENTAMRREEIGQIKKKPPLIGNLKVRKGIPSKSRLLKTK